MRLPAFTLLIVAGTALGGCATASTSSFTQAPLFLSIEDQGESATAADEVLAPYGSRDRGVVNYSVTSGNALLPVRAVTVLDAGVQANLLNTPIGAAVTIGQTGPLDAGASVNAGAVGVTANLTSGTVTTTVAVPGNTNTTVLSPGLSVGPSSLITAGPVLGAAAAAPPVVTGNVTGLITTTATDLSRLCALRPCR